jgi:hypothetical protein
LAFILLLFVALIFWPPLVLFGSNLAQYLFFLPIITESCLYSTVLPSKPHRIIFWLQDSTGFPMLLLFIRKPYVFPGHLGACQDGILRLVYGSILRPVF